MFLPTTNEMVYDAFAHRTLAGLGFSLGTCPREIPALPFRGIGQFDPVSAGVSAGVGIANTAIASWLADKRATGMQKVASTSIVNQLETLLNANKNAYLAGPGTCADQAAALSAFDSAMTWLASPSACGNIQLGTAGQNCINDRNCESGCKFPWIAWYRDPISNDTRAQCAVAPDAAEQASVTNIFNKISGSNVQTVPTSFDSNALASASTSTGASNPLTGSTSSDLASLSQSLMSGSVQIGSASVPTVALLFGGALILVLAMSGGK